MDSGAGCCALAHPVRTALPPLVSDQPIPQRNEGGLAVLLQNKGMTAARPRRGRMTTHGRRPVAVHSGRQR